MTNLANITKSISKRYYISCNYSACIWNSRKEEIKNTHFRIWSRSVNIFRYNFEHNQRSKCERIKFRRNLWQKIYKRWYQQLSLLCGTSKDRLSLSDSETDKLRDFTTLTTQRMKFLVSEKSKSTVIWRDICTWSNSSWLCIAKKRKGYRASRRINDLVVHHTKLTRELSPYFYKDQKSRAAKKHVIIFEYYNLIVERIEIHKRRTGCNLRVKEESIPSLRF